MLSEIRFTYDKLQKKKTAMFDRPLKNIYSLIKITQENPRIFYPICTFLSTLFAEILGK